MVLDGKEWDGIGCYRMGLEGQDVMAHLSEQLQHVVLLFLVQQCRHLTNISIQLLPWTGPVETKLTYLELKNYIWNA